MISEPRKSPLAPAAALVLAWTLASGCASTSHSFAGPEEAAVAVLTALEEGRSTDAERIYGTFTRSRTNEELLYPVLYDAARSRFEGGEPARAAQVLELLVDRHPTAAGSREALVYALFLERAELGEATSEQSARLSEAIAGLRGTSTRIVPWVDLAETQLRIDEGRLDEARDSFARFLGTWEGEPASLLTYAEDLNRYLQTH